MFCGKCGSWVEEGNSFCVKCGAKVSAAPAVQAAPEPLEKRCAACGTVLGDDAAFCPKCGQASGANNAPAASQPAANNAPPRALIQMNNQRNDMSQPVTNSAAGASQPAANSAPPQSDWHGFVTAWLILGIVFSSLGGLIIVGASIAGAFDYYYYDLTEYFVLNGFLTLLGLGCYIALLCRKMLGFSLLIGISLVQIISSFVTFGMITGLISLVGAVVGIVILWAIMQLRKNGKSAWELLK